MKTAILIGLALLAVVAVAAPVADAVTVNQSVPTPAGTAYVNVYVDDNCAGGSTCTITADGGFA